MSKRLEIAKALLKEDGVIFVSIDNKEVAHLRLLMDSIFGEQNFKGKFIWNSTAGSNMGKNIVTITEYVLVYSKSKKLLLQGKEVKRAPGMIYKDEFFADRGYYAKDKLDSRRQESHYTESLNFPITAPDGEEIYPGGTPENNGFNWLWSKKKVNWGIKNGFIIIEKNKNGEWRVYNKRYQKVNNKGIPFTRRKAIKNIIPLNYTSTSEGTKQMREMGLRFDYSKPVKLIKDFIEYYSDKEAIVLDFFAGSGTTGQAVMELNKEDNGKRRYFLCTNNEVSEERVRDFLYKQQLIPKSNKTEFNKFKKENPEIVADFMKSKEYQELGIARSVTQPRIKKVIEGYTTPKGEEVEGLTGNKVEYYKITPSKKGEVNE